MDAPADPQAARLTGIAMLARRDFAERVLRERLVQRGYEARAAAEAVTALAEERLVDDQRFLVNRIASRVSRGHGPRRIRLELEQSGLARAAVDDALKGAGIDWRVQATDVLRRRFGTEPPENAAARAARVRFLLYRGFLGEHVQAALRGLGPGEDADDIEEPADLAQDLDDDVDF